MLLLISDALWLFTIIITKFCNWSFNHSLTRFFWYFFISFMEDSGYMSRAAFIMDKMMHKMGLHGKSFIPLIMGFGCNVPAVMATRTIENRKSRLVTMMVLPFMSCSARLPIYLILVAAFFPAQGSLVLLCIYALGIFMAILMARIFSHFLMKGDNTPFVMELPAYHMPTIKNVLRSMWERGWSFIKKAGTIILLSTIAVWFTSFFGFAEDGFRMLEEDELDMSILASIGSAIAWIFKPLGFGTWQATVAAITGLVAKENIVGTMGILYGADGSVYENLASVFTGITGYAFLVFNLLCAPCFAAMGAIKREMNNTKWFWFAIGYECGFAYVISFIVNQIGSLCTGAVAGVGGIIEVILGFVVLAGLVYMVCRKDKYRK